MDFDLIEDIISERGDHTGIDEMSKDDLIKYCEYYNLNMIDSNDLEKIILDIYSQQEVLYEGSTAQQMDELFNDLVIGSRDSRAGTARYVVEELFRSYELIEQLQKEIQKAEEVK